MFYPSINIYSSDHISTVHITGVHDRKPLNQNLLQHFRTDPIKQNAEILPQIWVSISHIKSRMRFQAGTGAGVDVEARQEMTAGYTLSKSQPTWALATRFPKNRSNQFPIQLCWIMRCLVIFSELSNTHRSEREWRSDSEWLMGVINAVIEYKRQDGKVNTIILPCLRYGHRQSNNKLNSSLVGTGRKI